MPSRRSTIARRSTSRSLATFSIHRIDSSSISSERWKTRTPMPDRLSSGASLRVAMVNETQRRAAALVGIAYLLALAPAIFSEFYVSRELGGRADMGATARNILEHQSLYRLGIASSLVVCGVDIALIAGLYLTLEPINRLLALLAAFVRLVETAIMVMIPLNDMALLRVVSDAEYVRRIGADRLADMTEASLGAHGGIYGVALVFAGLGSALFCYLWYRSRYVPRLL